MTRDVGETTWKSTTVFIDRFDVRDPSSFFEIKNRSFFYVVATNVRVRLEVKYELVRAKLPFNQYRLLIHV